MTNSKDLIPLVEDAEFGPAMRALPNDRMRRFVIACIEYGRPTQNGTVNHTEAAIAAGYGNGDRASAQVQGSRLAHDQRIQDAMLEESKRRFGSALPMATAAIVHILQNATKNSDVMKAATIIMDRAGIPLRTEHDVSVTRVENAGEKVDRIIALAKARGLDPLPLLKQWGIPIPPQLSGPAPVEATFEVVATSEGLEDFLS